MAGGRPPKEKSFFNALSVALAQADGVDLAGQRVTKLRQVAEKLVECALQGEGWAIKEIADRTDGKPMQAVEHTGEDGGPVVFTTIYETLRDKAEAEARDKLN